MIHELSQKEREDCRRQMEQEQASVSIQLVSQRVGSGSQVDR